jgi:hypothetical protein
LAFPSSWIPVEPNKNSAAILGPLPFRRGSKTLAIPASVVPVGATGLLVFAWAALSGKNSPLAYWHFVSEVEGRRDFFSLLVAGDPTGASVMCNSQAFWLPMPPSRNLIVTLHAADLPSPTNKGEVEIHGYSPGPTQS